MAISNGKNIYLPCHLIRQSVTNYQFIDPFIGPGKKGPPGIEGLKYLHT